MRPELPLAVAVRCNTPANAAAHIAIGSRTGRIRSTRQSLRSAVSAWKTRRYWRWQSARRVPPQGDSVAVLAVPDATFVSELGTFVSARLSHRTPVGSPTGQGATWFTMGSGRGGSRAAPSIRAAALALVVAGLQGHAHASARRCCPLRTVLWRLQGSFVARSARRRGDRRS